MIRNTSDKTDHRRHARRSGKGIRGDILNSKNIEVLNISDGGAAIESGKRLELGREYTIRIRCGGSEFRIRVLVVWAELISKERPDGSIVPVYKAGVQFRDMSPEKETLIQDCMAEMIPGAQG